MLSLVLQIYKPRSFSSGRGSSEIIIKTAMFWASDPSWNFSSWDNTYTNRPTHMVLKCHHWKPDGLAQ